MATDRRAELEHAVSAAESALDVPAWITAMRRLWFFLSPSGGPPFGTPIPVSRAFFEAAERHADDGRVGDDVGRIDGVLVFRRCPLRPAY